MARRHNKEELEAIKRTRSSHHAMKARCFYPSNGNFARYGGRGITVHPRWLSFPAFLEDMGLRPAGTTLDRYPDREGNYEPGNCRWATLAEQRANTKKPQKPINLIEHDGKKLSCDEWAKILGIPAGTIFDRCIKRRIAPATAFSMQKYERSAA